MFRRSLPAAAVLQRQTCSAPALSFNSAVRCLSSDLLSLERSQDHRSKRDDELWGTGAFGAAVFPDLPVVSTLQELASWFRCPHVRLSLSNFIKALTLRNKAVTLTSSVPRVKLDPAPVATFSQPRKAERVSLCCWSGLTRGAKQQLEPASTTTRTFRQ